jgi:hypothetical protein
MPARIQSSSLSQINFYQTRLQEPHAIEVRTLEIRVADIRKRKVSISEVGFK